VAAPQPCARTSGKLFECQYRYICTGCALPLAYKCVSSPRGACLSGSRALSLARSIVRRPVPWDKQTTYLYLMRGALTSDPNSVGLQQVVTAS
jgi:hypothetical protein